MQYIPPTPVSWHPVDFSTEIMEARAQQTVKIQKYQDKELFIKKMKQQGYCHCSIHSMPVQPTTASTIICGTSEVYAVAHGCFSAAITYGYFSMKKVVRKVDDNQVLLYPNCLFFTMHMGSPIGAWAKWMTGQLDKKSNWLETAGMDKLADPAMLNYNDLSHTMLWRLVGPKSASIKESQLDDRRIELRL